MPSLTVENYLKAILQLVIATKSEWISTGQLAATVNVSPGSVTSMLKTLAESGLATYKPYEGVSLTKAGRNSGPADAAPAPAHRAVSRADARI